MYFYRIILLNFDNQGSPDQRDLRVRIIYTRRLIGSIRITQPLKSRTQNSYASFSASRRTPSCRFSSDVV